MPPEVVDLLTEDQRNERRAWYVHEQLLWELHGRAKALQRFADRIDDTQLVEDLEIALMGLGKAIETCVLRGHEV